MAKKEKKQEKLERHFIVGLQDLLKCPRPKRANKAVYLLKRFAYKHFRIKAEDVLISNKVNEFLWKNGREKVPRKVSIKVVVVDNKANIFLRGEKVKAKKEEKKREEKKEEKLTGEEKAAVAEKQKKKEEKKMGERAAEKAALKRGKE